MSNYFIGRQPIFDRSLSLYGYELLFRSSEANLTLAEVCLDTATSQVIVTAYAEIGLDKLIGDKLAFINVTHKYLANPDLLPLEPEKVVLEILEDVVICEDVINGVKELHSRGFTIALDDFIYSEQYEAILPFVSLIKLDITLIERAEWAETVERLSKYNCKLLAEKVETIEEYEELKELDIDYFQGYFFAHPKVVSGKRIASSNVSLLQMMSAINDPNAGVDELQAIMSKDIAMSVKALNYVNSAASGLPRQVDSIREAIVYIGRNTMRNWINLFIMASIDDKPAALMTTGLVRAKFCESLAAEAGFEAPDSFFTVGLFSILDSLMDVDMSEVLEHMSVNDDMRAALVSREGQRGEILQYAIDIEEGDIDYDQGKQCAGLEADVVSNLYFDAMLWADEATSGM